MVAAAPAIYEQVLISRGPRARGAVLKGMLPQYERKVSDLLNSVTLGSAAALEEQPATADQVNLAEQIQRQKQSQQQRQRTGVSAPHPNPPTTSPACSSA